MNEDTTVDVHCCDDQVIKLKLMAMNQSVVFLHTFPSLCNLTVDIEFLQKSIRISMEEVKVEIMETVVKWCHHHIGAQQPIIQEKPGTDECILFKLTEWESDFFKSLQTQDVIDVANVAHTLKIRHLLLFCCQELASRMSAVNLDPEKIREMFGFPDDLTEEEKDELQNMAVTSQVKHHIQMKNNAKVIKHTETTHTSFKIEVGEDGMPRDMGLGTVNSTTVTINSGLNHGSAGHCECTDCKLVFDRRPKRFNANAVRTFERRERLKRLLKKRQAEKEDESSDDNSIFAVCEEESDECESEISKTNDSTMTHKFSELSVEELVEFVNRGSNSRKQNERNQQCAQKLSEKKKKRRHRKNKVSVNILERKSDLLNANGSVGKKNSNKNSQMYHAHIKPLDDEQRQPPLPTHKTVSNAEFKNLKRSRPISLSNCKTKIECIKNAFLKNQPSNPLKPIKEPDQLMKMQNMKAKQSGNTSSKSLAHQIEQKEPNGYNDAADSTKHPSCSSDASNFRISERLSNWILVTGPRKTSHSTTQRSGVISSKSNSTGNKQRSLKPRHRKTSTGNKAPRHDSTFPTSIRRKVKENQCSRGECRHDVNCNTKNIPSLLDIKVDESLIAVNAKRQSFPLSASTDLYIKPQKTEPRPSAKETSIERKRRQLEKMCEESCKYGAIGQERQKRMEALTGKRRQEIDVLFCYETICERDSNPPYFQFMRELKMRNRQKSIEEEPRVQYCKLGELGPDRHLKSFSQSARKRDLHYQQFSFDFPALGSTTAHEHVPCRSLLGYSGII